MKYLSILPLLFITAMLWGQAPDHKRMKRDIEVAENIIDALLEEVSSNGTQSYSVDGTYLDSYGMLFTIQNKWGGFRFSPKISIAGQTILRGKAEFPHAAEEDRLEGGVKDSIATTAMTNSEDLKSVVKTFFADYGYLLTQLPEDEKICIKYTEGGNNLFGLASTNVFPSRASQNKTSAKPGFTAVIQQETVQDFRLRKIDREALIKKIEFTETEVDNPETDRQLILLNSIFNRLYQRDLSEGFFMRSNGSVEEVAGLGALFSYNFASKGHPFFGANSTYLLRSNDDENERRRLLAAIEQLDPEEREKFEAVYPVDKTEDNTEEEPDFDEFLQDFKTNIIEYGSTVRNLKDDEVLSFELELPSCRNCDDRPEMVKITAKQSLLEKYRQGDIDLENAVEQLQITY